MPMPKKQRMKMVLVLMATSVVVTAPVAPTNTDSKRPPNGKVVQDTRHA